MKRKKEYYVYIYWRLDIDEPFYIGKGKDDRWKKVNRENFHFNNIVNKYPIAVEIIKDDLTEEQAFYWEEKIIEILVFEYGYSIDIPNNRSDNEKLFHLVNCTWGGEGCSGGNWTLNKTEKEIKEITDRMVKTRKEKGIGIGENNPMYGVHRYGEDNPMYGRHHTEETKQKISEANSGENHYLFGKGYLIKGENNPMFGRHHTEEAREKMGKKGVKHSRSTPVICLTTKRIFECVKYGAIFYNIKGDSQISKCCRKKRDFCGKLDDGTKLVWRYLNYKHNKKYRIKEGEVLRGKDSVHYE